MTVLCDRLSMCPYFMCEHYHWKLIFLLQSTHWTEVLVSQGLMVVVGTLLVSHCWLETKLTARQYRVNYHLPRHPDEVGANYLYIYLALFTWFSSDTDVIGCHLFHIPKSTILVIRMCFWLCESVRYDCETCVSRRVVSYYQSVETDGMPFVCLCVCWQFLRLLACGYFIARLQYRTVVDSYCFCSFDITRVDNGEISKNSSTSRVVVWKAFTGCDMLCSIFGLCFHQFVVSVLSSIV